jgi:hypothetical protein
MASRKEKTMQSLLRYIPGRLLGPVAALCVWCGAALGADHFVVPGSAPGGDGSAAQPWSSIAEAFGNGVVNSGDTIHLAEGDYGAVTLQGLAYDQLVTLRAAPGTLARFSRLVLDRTRNVAIDGITLWPDPGSGGGGALVSETGQGNVLRNLDIRGRQAADMYTSWSAQDWRMDPRVGAKLMGSHSILENSRLTGLAEGLGIIGPDATVIGNTFRGFGGDAIRIVGDGALVRFNNIADCVKISENHDDGIQAWARGPDGRAGQGVLSGVTIDANTILEWTGPPDHPLRCSLQGIGLFDGMFEDLTISNNVVSVSAYHGISVAGAVNARIVNNTVVNAVQISRKGPWIQLADHKNGTPTLDSLVANNIAPRFLGGDTVRAANRFEGNHVVIYPVRDLEQDADGAWRLHPDGRLRGLSDPLSTPPTDRTGQRRDPSDGLDPGAFEGS